ELSDIEHRRAEIARDGFGGPAVEIRIDDDDVGVQFSHFRLHFRQMRGGWRNAGLRLEEQVDVQREALAKIRPGIVIGDDVLPFEGSKQMLPSGHFCIEGSGEFLEMAW